MRSAVFTAVLALVTVLGAAGCRTAPTALPAEWERAIRPGDVLASLFPTGEGTVYLVPDEQVADIPRCTATVVLKVPCAMVVRTDAGQLLHIGGPGATPLVGCFQNRLREGQTCVLPDAFVEFREREGEAIRKANAAAGR